MYNTPGPRPPCRNSKPDFADRALFARLFGPDVYAVGGFVRDVLRGVEPDEVDLLVARRTVEDITARLARPSARSIWSAAASA